MQVKWSNSQLKLRVLLADDHTLIAEAVGTVLEESGGFTVDIVETYHAALNAMSKSMPYDIVMLDLRMPGVVGLDSLSRAVEAANGAKIALFTANAERHVVKRALEIGVNGVIPKNLALNSLESVLRLINSGQTFLPPSFVVEPDIDNNRADLTEKELLVLKQAAEGMTNKHIARDLGVSETTIKMHMRAVCKKLGAKNRAHAAVIARNTSLIDV